MLIKINPIIKINQITSQQKSDSPLVVRIGSCLKTTGKTKLNELRTQTIITKTEFRAVGGAFKTIFWHLPDSRVDNL